ncbi:MAG TPA: glycosyltransferase [Bryobacteraceae bacterium]|nr:glycosyltransferase [Bryobacteraceae bacterium]
MLLLISAGVLGALLLGSWVYCVLTWLAARNYLAQSVPETASREPISILKPLSGLDDGLEENLRSFFTQDYPSFEILFAVRTEADPAHALVERLRTQYPGVPAKLLLTGEPPWPNAKSWSLHLMQQEALHNLLVMSDSDIRVDSAMLRTLAREFSDPHLAVTTCPYRAVPGPSFWSKLEAIGMNTEFLGGVLVARMLDGMKFALGPTIAARKSAIEAVGGWPYLQEFLAEDFVLGNEAAAKGLGVALSRYVVEHRIGAQSFAKNAHHRLRWCRSTRRSRPAGYVGQLFTNPLPISLALLGVLPASWPAFLGTLLLRTLAAHAAAGRVLRDPLTAREFYLVPLQDLLSFFFWVGGFFGNTIDWRGETYLLEKDGRFTKKGA